MHEEILGIIRKKTGALLLPSINLEINKTLSGAYFLGEYPHYLLYRDRDFFEKYEFFRFSDPIDIRRNIFRLSIFFLSTGIGTSSVCTGYGLSSFHYAGPQKDAEIETQLKNFLIEELGTVPITPPHTAGKIWSLKWGSVYLGATLQNGTEPEIGIGWKTNVAAR